MDLFDWPYIGYKSRTWGTHWEHKSPKNPIQPPKGKRKLSLWCMLLQLVLGDFHSQFTIFGLG